ncbi:hypothetical protein BGZ54_004031 [Gamsiella multidivaricata]|nr:hypothetical protein BGZ54_004031 [Gamsiella multidivaricata]
MEFIGPGHPLASNSSSQQYPFDQQQQYNQHFTVQMQGDYGGTSLSMEIPRGLIPPKDSSLFTPTHPRSSGPGALSSYGWSNSSEQPANQRDQMTIPTSPTFTSEKSSLALAPSFDASQQQPIEISDSTSTDSDTEDEDFAAPIASTQCTNCDTQTTPLWRRDKEGNPLCNACGLFLKLHGRIRPLSLKTDVIRKRNRRGLNSKKNAANTGAEKQTDVAENNNDESYVHQAPGRNQQSTADVAGCKDAKHDMEGSLTKDSSIAGGHGQAQADKSTPMPSRDPSPVLRGPTIGYFPAPHTSPKRQRRFSNDAGVQSKKKELHQRPRGSISQSTPPSPSRPSSGRPMNTPLDLQDALPSPLLSDIQRLVQEQHQQLQLQYQLLVFLSQQHQEQQQQALFLNTADNNWPFQPPLSPSPLTLLQQSQPTTQPVPQPPVPIMTTTNMYSKISTPSFDLTTAAAMSMASPSPAAMAHFLNGNGIATPQQLSGPGAGPSAGAMRMNMPSPSSNAVLSPDQQQQAYAMLLQRFLTRMDGQ